VLAALMYVPTPQGFSCGEGAFSKMPEPALRGAPHLSRRLEIFSPPVCHAGLSLDCSQPQRPNKRFFQRMVFRTVDVTSRLLLYSYVWVVLGGTAFAALAAVESALVCGAVWKFRCVSERPLLPE